MQRICFSPSWSTLLVVVMLGSTALAQPPRAPLPLEPGGNRGEAVFPALEGWHRHEDGSFTIILGYFNRNNEAVDIPVGPNNQILPGGPDLGQPTRFLAGRSWGVFAIDVPADFADQRLTWTISINNQRSEVTFWLNPAYYVDPMLNRANGNVPPMLRVTSSDGDTLQGPAPSEPTASYTASVGEPLELWAQVWDTPLTNPPPPRRRGRSTPPLTLSWRLYRGPADVAFRAPTEDGDGEADADGYRREFDDLAGGETTTLVTFTEPGEYRLMATANDVSGNGGGGDQCCWTTAHVDVTVR
jgi:hypothetical protein